MRLLKKEIAYCDECPYHYAEGAGRIFCNHHQSAVTTMKSSKITMNGSVVSAFVIPKACPLPVLVTEENDNVN